MDLFWLQGLELKMAVFWVVTPYTEVSEALAASIIRTMALFMEVVSISETSVNFYDTTNSNNSKTAIFILASMRI
jgi:hypothetical protein